MLWEEAHSTDGTSAILLRDTKTLLASSQGGTSAIPRFMGRSKEKSEPPGNGFHCPDSTNSVHLSRQRSTERSSASPIRVEKSRTIRPSPITARSTRPPDQNPDRRPNSSDGSTPHAIDLTTTLGRPGADIPRAGVCFE